MSAQTPTCFQGLSAFPLTPMDADGCVDAATLRGLLGRLSEATVDSIGLLGSTGSYPYLDRAQRRRAIEAAVEAVGGKIPLLVGIGALRTDEAVHFGQDAKAAGADAVLLAPMSYTPLTDDEVFTHFETVAKAVGLPLCVYNNPSTTHFNFGADLVARLSRLDHIAAVKNPAAGVAKADVDELRARTTSGFSLGYSGDAAIVPAMLAGGDAWYSVIGGLFPVAAMKLMTAVRAGDAVEAQRLDAHLRPLWALFAEFGGGLRVMYAAAKHLGLCHRDPPRPILPLAGDAARRVGQVVDALDL